ncbi:MAG: DUF58 domain-containing protein [Actinomycetota bacterium]
MSLTPRAALIFLALVSTVLTLPIGIVSLLLLAFLAIVGGDARAAHSDVRLRRAMPRLVARGIAAPVSIEIEWPAASTVRLRQATNADVELNPSEDGSSLTAELIARRRGRHVVPPVAARGEGPLGLASWQRDLGEAAEILVYPDLPAARRLALAVRQGRFRDAGRHGRGPLGLGTDFESIRDYVPDDDIRQVNWLATSRMGKPMSNQFRIDQDQDVMCLVDTGRLMGAPLGDRTRLDSAIDAAAAVALVADELGDRCGTIAFDETVRRAIRPRRSGGHGVVQVLFDLESTAKDSDYELAFRTVGGAKRSFILVLTDLIEEAAARPLIAAMPHLTRRHVVVVATAEDLDLSDSLGLDPIGPVDVYRKVIALDMMNARDRVVRSLRGAGADVVVAPPNSLSAACVRLYLRSKARVRL